MDGNYFQNSFGSYDNFFDFANSGKFEVSGESLQQELSVRLEQKVVRYRNLFYHSIITKYAENLPSAIRCKNINEETDVDWLKVEVGLRNNFNMCVGENRFGDLVLLGYTNNYNTSTNPATFFVQDSLTHENITFIIPENERLDEYKEIKFINGEANGNFAVIRNKALQYSNDFQFIQMHAEKLAEIQASRFSLSIQAKVMTFFKGEIGDETLNQVIEAFYNGAVTAKTDGFFDPKNQMYTMDNSNLSANMTELKTEYQNTVSELNTGIGINTTAVDKKSGVSPMEVSGNSALVDLFGDGYLAGRNNGLILLNARYDLHLEATYNKDAVDFLMSQLKDGENDENNNVTDGISTVGTD